MADIRFESTALNRKDQRKNMLACLIKRMLPSQVTHPWAVFILLACFFVGAVEVAAKDYTFSWQPNPEPVTGYKLYYKKGGTGISPAPPFNGTGATEGASPIDVGKQLSFTITGLDDAAVYHFVLTAYNENNESEYTNVVTVAPKPTIYGIQTN